MKEIQVIMSDDVIFAETGHREPATGTHRLLLDDHEVELDLSESVYQEMLHDLARYIKAGHEPDSGPLLPRRPEQHSRSGNRFTPGIIEYNRAMRAWADARGLKNPKHPELPAYKGPAGQYKHPKWLKDKYAQYLAEHPGEGGMPPGS